MRDRRRSFVAPAPTAHRLVLLDDELVAPSPPLRHEGRVGHGAPHALARGVEDSLHADLAVSRHYTARSLRKGCVAPWRQHP